MAIKKLQSNFTTPDQSKRLLELGVPADSADCVYDCSLIGGEKYYSLSILEDELFSVYKRRWGDPCTDIIPCWSVGRLLEIIALCYKFDIPSFGSVQIYATDFKKGIVVDILICYIKISIKKIDFSKLED